MLAKITIKGEAGINLESLFEQGDRGQNVERQYKSTSQTISRKHLPP